MALVKEAVEIKLVKETKGLGFNICGGSDQPEVPRNTGIFVSKIREGGVAEIDARLREGDQIIKVNDTVLLDVTHQTATNALINSGTDVTLHVLPQRLAKARKEAAAANFPVVPIIAVSAVVLVVGYVVYRYTKK